MAEETGVHPGSWVGDTVEEVKKLPTWGKIAVGVVILGVAYLGYRAYKNSTSANASVGAAQVASGQGINPASGGTQSPFAGVPSATNTGASVPLIPSGVSPIFDTTGNLIGWQQGSPPPSPVTQTPSLLQQIRNAFSSPDVAKYDKTHSGVPERSSPGGAVVGTLPFGSTITLADSNPVSGANNFGKGNTGGNNLWYKLPNGLFVSQYDIKPPVQSVGSQPPPIQKV